MKTNQNQRQTQSDKSPFEVRNDNRSFLAKLMDKRRTKRVIREGHKDSKRIMAEHRQIQAHVKPLTINEDSLQYKVREHLISGKSITVLDCLRLFHSTELRHAISVLRKHMEIKDEWITTPNGKRIKKYYR